MAAQTQGVPNMEQFENYFKRADLDGDGKISGHEAVTFFQGSNLPKHVLAQIWMHADQARTGFLGRAEFFNALRLVTVAQSKRELTPEIVKAALYGPAAAKIPPPQINLPPTPTPQSNSIGAATSPAMRPVSPMPSQNVGFRGQTPLGNNQQFFSSQQSQSVRPPQPLSGGSSFQPQQQVNIGPRGTSMGSPSGPVTNNWIGGSGAMGGPRGVNPPTVSAPPLQQSPASLLALPSASESKATAVSGNGSASASTSALAFGDDLFSANAPQPKQSPSLLGYSASSTTVSAPASVGPQSSVKPSALDSLQSSFSMQPASSQVQRPQTPQTPVSSQGPSSFSLTGASVATADSSPNSSQIPWPKMKASDVQKYTKVFMEVDTDRDGKITGEQARNLFLSWRLPRDVLKQVWDLSDQDSDSMLSLREFCFALYLMERYREGRPLPASLPSNVMYDETLLSMTGLSNATYGNAAWGPSSGFGLQGMPGVRPRGLATGVRPVMQGPVPPPNSANQTNQPGLSALERGDSSADHVGHIESNVANSNAEEASAAEKKVEEKVILDSREKLEFYRTKMQDLVLYKRRCDNKLNEIIERASADKREAETLMKKYEEKYKQVAEIASKLTIEEASFREIQERKSELRQAIVKMEQGGSADGILQVRADRIQSDLDELLKALADRCKKHGLEVKSKALIVLPTGWQPGIPELAAVWDEDWDKFEDEGFSTEITVDGKNITTSSTSVHKENASSDNGFAHDSPSSADGKVSHSPRTVEHAFDSESAYAHSEDEVARSPRGSPLSRTDGESPSNIFSNTHFDKASEADPDIHGSFDDSNWGAFDNDDVDSVWGFNTKDPDSSFNQRDSFGSSDFGVNPIRTSSTLTDNVFQNRTSFFDESVPATPMSNFGNSSPRYSEAGDHYFDNNFSRFDSFRTNDSGFFAQPEKLARFDSISSSKDYGHSRAFTFDDSDPFGSSGPFKVSSDNQTPKKSSDNWNAF